MFRFRCHLLSPTSDGKLDGSGTRKIEILTSYRICKHMICLLPRIKCVANCIVGEIALFAGTVARPTSPTNTIRAESSVLPLAARSSLKHKRSLYVCIIIKTVIHSLVDERCPKLSLWYHYKLCNLCIQLKHLCDPDSSLYVAMRSNGRVFVCPHLCSGPVIHFQLLAILNSS